MSAGDWAEGAHGVYLERDNNYDEGPGGDNWSYIDRKTLCVVDYRPKEPDQSRVPSHVPAIVAGPFPTLNAAKVAFRVIYGSIW